MDKFDTIDLCSDELYSSDSSHYSEPKIEAKTEEKEEKKKMDRKSQSSPRILFAIDLGTTFSSVARWDGCQSKVKIVKGTSNTTHFASIIHYKANKRVPQQYEILIADNVQDNARPQYVIIHSKRFLGLLFKNLPEGLIGEYKFEIREGPNGLVQFKIDLECGKVIITNPMDVATKILSYLKSQMDLSYKKDHFDPEINYVITVPGYFTSLRKERTLRAGKNAGMKKLYVCVEPIAAIMSQVNDQIKRYHEMFEKDQINRLNICVVDQGGGTTDVGIIELKFTPTGDKVKWELQVLKTAGHAFLGGVDYTFCIYKYLVAQFKKKSGSWDNLKEGKLERIHSTLFADVKKQKKMLNARSVTKVTFGLEVRDQYYTVDLTPSKYKEICAKHVDSLKETIVKCVKGEEIHEVFLVGGSSSVTFVIDLIAEIFNEIQPEAQIINIQEQREAVCLGAAVIGSLRAGYNIKGHEVTFTATTAFPIRMEVEGPNGTTYYQSIIQKDEPLPTAVERFYENLGAKGVAFKFYEGDSKEDVSKNVFLTCAEILFTKDRKVGKGRVTFQIEITEDGIFTGWGWAVRHPNQTRTKIESFIGVKDINHEKKVDYDFIGVKDINHEKKVNSNKRKLPNAKQPPGIKKHKR